MVDYFYLFVESNYNVLFTNLLVFMFWAVERLQFAPFLPRNRAMMAQKPEVEQKDKPVD